MELSAVNWTNIFTVVGFGFGMVLLILSLLVFLRNTSAKYVLQRNISRLTFVKKRWKKNIMFEVWH
jgi:Na+-transporting methylmalonyl-CoA/oxaloacetate decarboxylase gamma subunit